MKIAFTPIVSKNNNIQELNNRIYATRYISQPVLACDVVTFSGKVPHIKRPDVNLEIKKLLRQINEILTSGGDISMEERMFQAYERVLHNRQRVVAKLKELDAEVDEHLAKPDKGSASYREEIKILYEKIQKLKAESKVKIIVKKPTEEEIKADYKLLNLFKTSIINEHFDLKKVYLNYYKDLNSIRTVKELAEKFPKLIPPQKPENIIADRILNSLTRDFYEKLDVLLQQKDTSEAAEFIFRAIEKTHNIPQLKTKDINTILNYDRKIGSVFGKKVLSKYYELVESGSIASVPIARKAKGIELSEIDLKLLNLDYDDYVLHTFREMYLNGKKFKDIKFTDGITEIDFSKITDKHYKVDKVSEKIKKFISDANLIKTHQRDYENFTTEELKNRISYYSDKLENNETLLEKMIDFTICRFHDEDKPMIIKFLRELDAIWDGEKTAQEAAETINKLNLRPVGTEKLNEAERQAALIQKSLENKEFLKLKRKQDDFDEAVNLLYQNNMNYAAEICTKYRPESVTEIGFKDADFLINLIREYKINDKDLLIEKSILETKLKRWNSYIMLERNSENPELLATAQRFAVTEDGSIDIDRAGKYLLNHEILSDFPQCLEYYSKPELLSRLMELCNGDKSLATLYLCKYDSYLDMSQKEKTFVSKIAEKFDLKDSVDKFLLKSIIEKDYVNTDTIKLVKINDNNVSTIPATISKRVKQEIFDYYRYPECLNIFKSFEDALSSRASSRNSAGIKRVLGDDNYSYELKIMGYPDRLFAKDESLKFDFFSKQGLH